MRQFLADNIDQMDLALDQLAMRDRNFDRFALLLIDNVIELTLHQHAKDKEGENKSWGRHAKPRHDTKIVENALGQYFEAKVKLAKHTGMVQADICDSLQYVHSYRNTAYHQGLRHEGISHSLALFHFQNACLVLTNYKPPFWSWGSDEQISHRAKKYLGDFNFFNSDCEKKFQAAYKRLLEVGASMGDNLVASLSADMKETIDAADHNIRFLTKDSPEKKTRKEHIIYCQAWDLAFTEQGKSFAKENKCTAKSVGGYVDWLASNYPWPVTNDPISSWNNRLESLKKETDKHLALKKYCDFLKQTERIRGSIEKAAIQLDNHIQEMIDRARGK